MILVTGGAGFIGSNFILQWIDRETGPVVTLDKLTYAGNLFNLESLANNPRHTFIHGDIADRHAVRELLKRYRPRYILHCAAESHVDRSIAFPELFIATNISGTFALLEETLSYWKNLSGDERNSFRFLFLSTDEVYGSLSPNAAPADETSPYAPNSPYAASKASGDHLVRAYHRTFELPVLITHSTNNFGPRQFPEKLIPLSLKHALEGKAIAIYGDGSNSRDWIFVEEHCKALRCVLKKGVVGECYNISAGNEKTNLEIIHSLCAILDELKPRSSSPYSELIRFVKDRPGHDKRYALNHAKLLELGWRSETDFEDALKKTILWYLKNPRFFGGVC